MTRPRDDAAHHDSGYTLLETLMSLVIMGMVMSSLAVFFSRSMSMTSQQGDQQIAAQLVTDGVDQVRKVPGCKLRSLCGNWWPTNDSHTVDRVAYNRTWTRLSVVSPDLLPVVVTVSWRGCAGGTCTFSATTLISTTISEPVFNTT